MWKWNDNVSPKHWPVANGYIPFACQLSSIFSVEYFQDQGTILS